MRGFVANTDFEWFTFLRERPHYQSPDPKRHYKVGCIMISEPVFFEDAAWVREPAGFSRNIVRGKSFPAGEGEGRRLWEECRARARVGMPIASEPVASPGPSTACSTGAT